MNWQGLLAEQLIAHGIQSAAWVPDKRLDPIARRLMEVALPLRTLTREEECVGYAAGYRAAGGMPLVMLQSSGLGNSINALSSLAVPYGLGFPMVVSVRGMLGEQNPVQVGMGRIVSELLVSIGAEPFPLHDAEDTVVVVRGALDLAREARKVVAIVLQPELDLRNKARA